MFIAVAVLCVVAASPRAADRETKVLILNGVDPTLPAFLAVDTAMRDTLAKDTTRRVQIFAEALDASRFAFPDFEQEFLALLRKKYKGVTFDVVVPITELAFHFVRRHRSELWPDAWVFFHGVPTRVI